MNLSIRKFLLINLLLAITITTTIIVIGNFYSDQRDIQNHLDRILKKSAFMFEALIGHYLQDHDNHHDIEAIQEQLDEIPQQTHKLGSDQPLLLQRWHNYIGTLQFQAWDKQGRLFLHSANAPKQPLSNGKIGFSDHFVAGHNWRVYTVYNAELDYLLELAEKHDHRAQFIRTIAIDDFYIMLWAYPIAGGLIRMIIGRGLSSLRRVARAVASRDPANLEPVDAENVPMEIKPLTAELNKLFLRLNQTLAREQRFAGDAAHELRTPLAALRAQTQVALKAKTEDDIRATLNNIIACVDRSTHVVEQLLTLSRISPDKETLDDGVKMDLVKLAQEMIGQLIHSAIKKDIEISLNNKEPVFIHANTTSISILARNLIDNAIRHTPEGGQVTVSVLAEGDKALLRVTDNGPGIAPELRSRVFERFFRVLGNKVTGSGLGLAIVQQIASLYNGDIKLGNPAEGRGLEVEIAFPRIH